MAPTLATRSDLHVGNSEPTLLIRHVSGSTAQSRLFDRPLGEVVCDAMLNEPVTITTR